MQKFKETVAPEVWNSSVEDAWSEWEATLTLEVGVIPTPSAEALALNPALRKRKAAEAAAALYKWHMKC